MRWLRLYVRSRRVPMALVVTAGIAALMWTLWSVFSNSRDAGPSMVILTVLMLVAALTLTLAGPDEALDRTAALPWPSRRAGHVLAALAVILGLMFLTLLTGARFTPAGVVVRDAVGLLGLTALSAPVIGAARAWFLPLGWTMAAAVYPQDGRFGQVATWQAQAPGSTAAAVTAGVLGLTGLVAYAIAGSLPPGPAETTG